MSGIIIDIGAGNGDFVYRLAKENPDRLIIGIDPNQKAIEKNSAKIYKKRPKGGLPNVLYVLATIEEIPNELREIANQVFINFPWGSLLKGIVKVQNKTWGNIKSVCQKGALVDLIFGYEDFTEAKVIKDHNLPYLDLSYMENTMLPKLKKLDWEALEIRKLTNADLKGYPSSWARKLAFGKDRTFYFLRLRNYS